MMPFTQFLVFAVATSVLVYVVAVREFRRHSVAHPGRFIIGAFLVESALCVWIGLSLGQMSMR